MSAGSPKVEALFAGEPPPPPVDPAPRIRRLRVVLAAAAPLLLLAIPCWTGVPGGALALLAYVLADAELVRIEGGLYSAEACDQLLRLRSRARLSLMVAIGTFLVQIGLLATSFYDAWLEVLLRLAGLAAAL